MIKDNEIVKPIKTLDIEVKEFINFLPYWAKSLCSEILLGNEITDDKIETSFSYLLEELSLKESSIKPNILISSNPGVYNDFKTNLTFDSLTNVEGVNALTENQKIEFTPKLTIIYGVNGAGKSGYVRLLKNSFYSKHKESILENINLQEGHKSISAIFNFTSDGTNIKLKYPDDSENGIFSQYAVFDGEIGKKHLSNRNGFIFRPNGLRLFNEFNSSLEKLNSRLYAEIQAKNVANPFADDDIFQGESEIKTFLKSLSNNSNLDDLNKHLPYSEEEKLKKAKIEKKYDDLKIALSQKEKAVRELYSIQSQLSSRKKNLENINFWFTQNQFDIINSNIKDYKTKLEIAKKEGTEKFDTDKIKHIGSIEWKQFIEAAEKFALTQSEKEYPEIGDYCLLCHQSINDPSKILITSYWDYIKSIAEQEAKEAKATLNKLRENYERLDFNQFPDNDILSVWLKDKYENSFVKLKEDLDKQKKLSPDIVFNINNCEIKSQTEIRLDLSILDTINQQITNDIKDYDEDKQNESLQKLLKEKTYLAHKEKLAVRYPDIEMLHKNMTWVNKANQFNKQSFKAQSTNTEKRLSKEYFNSDYVNSFNSECEILNGNFGIEIDARSSDAQSNRQLFLKGKDPSAILSEGEQKVISLADFIAETNIRTINKGIIFDDPVNSLDEERKSIIANRLVELSNDKQVIIFTHDLVFVSNLINIASDIGFAPDCHWIENRNGKPGQVWLRNSPSYEKKYRNSEPATIFYTDANKEDCSPEQREFYIRSGFTALRTCYEVLVINDLFKNVVQRYNERVSIDSLTSVKFDEELINELLDSFAQCCRHMEGHTHSDKYAYRKPEPSNLNDEIQRYESIRSKIRKFKSN